MTALHHLFADGSCVTTEWSGPLEYAAPPFSSMKEILGVREIEHVSVLWHGRLAHMFVSENGISEGLPVNYRASRIYANATLTRAGQIEEVYTDLECLPKTLYRECLIFGPALLWEGELE